jgi:hypothetical protein
VNPDEINIAFSSDDDRPVVEVGAARVATLADLVRAAPALKQPDQLPLYCRALNHLKFGTEYRLILDPDAYRARYQRRLESEDPKAPWQEGVVRVRDFGVCDTSEITAPRMEAGAVIFYVEDDFLGIPYRVDAPAPDHPEGEINYEPLPMSPLPE